MITSPCQIGCYSDFLPFLIHQLNSFHDQILSNNIKLKKSWENIVFPSTFWAGRTCLKVLSPPPTSRIYFTCNCRSNTNLLQLTRFYLEEPESLWVKSKSPSLFIQCHQPTGGSLAQIGMWNKPLTPLGNRSPIFSPFPAVDDLADRSNGNLLGCI